MKHLKQMLIVCLVLLPALSWAADDGYGYPIPGSYEATIMGTPAQLKPELPKEVPVKQLALEIFPDRKTPDVFFYNRGVRCTLTYQKEKAPLVFLIAGTGSNHNSTKLDSMMKQLYQAGYHVVTLPSPTHPNFIISASESSIPGDLTDDAADLYRVMEKVWGEVKDDIEVSDFYLGGYSLGGTQAAFVAKLDEQRKVFNFRKVLMINPAVSLYNSVEKIDATLDKIPGGKMKIVAFLNSTLAKLVEFYEEGDYVDLNNEFFFNVYKSKLLSEDEAGAVIGLAFRIASAGMIFDSDVMTNGGYVVPKNRVLKAGDPLKDYFRVAIHLSFIDYFNEYFYPYFQKKRPGLTREALIDAQSLKSIEGYLKSSQKFGVMTNENDLILAPGELDYLRQLFGARTKVYPRGGHLGNLEYKDNMAYMAGFFK
ncbi:MAG TPA: alpha/beta hydrolase [Geobacteraceae bacterium]|nr:alpha/beta hydrolase [Geobacteraceae bacterium]